MSDERASERLVRLIGVFRPVNLLIAAAGVWLGAHLSLHQAVPWWAMLAAMALAAAGNAHNDWTDTDKDRINHPERAGVDRSTLLLMAAGAVATGMGTLLFLTPAHLVLFTLNTAGLLVYNHWASRRALVGNLIVTLLVGSTIIFGALESGINERVVVAAAFAAAATLARELVKDVQDMEGDRSAGARTFAVVAGPQSSCRLVNLVLTLLVPATLLPFIMLEFGGTYLLGMGITCAILVVASPSYHASRTSPMDMKRSSRLLKWAMVTGTVALLFAESPII